MILLNKKIIIALIIIVLIVLGGLIVFSSGIKSDTQINFLSNNSLKNGDQVQFELKDAQGNALANQAISIIFEGNGEKQNFSITTDSQGKGGLLLSEQADGNYTITVSYGGDDKHNGCSANQTIKISGETSDSLSQNVQSSTASTNMNYDEELNDYYDSNGKIVGGQNDGADYNYIKNHPPTIVNGSLE